MSATRIQFETIRTHESIAARAEVYDYAADLHADQTTAWEENRDAGRTQALAPPSWEQCLDKSRTTRLQRERAETHENQLTNPWA